jgi:CBS domain containing-hemolysin-like protein
LGEMTFFLSTMIFMFGVLSLLICLNLRKDIFEKDYKKNKEQKKSVIEHSKPVFFIFSLLLIGIGMCMVILGYMSNDIFLKCATILAGFIIILKWGFLLMIFLRQNKKI